MAMIRPETEMKDVGIDWIGIIPNNWNIKPLYACLDEINQKNSPVVTTNILSLTNTDGVIPYSERGNQGNKSKENFEEYKVVYPNTIVANSMNILIGSVGLSQYEGCVSPVYYVYAAKPQVDIRYMNYLFQMEPFQKRLRQFANGILEIRLRVSSHDILHQKVTVPDYDEQQAIADYLDETCSKIDEIIAEAKASIDEYKELKIGQINKYTIHKMKRTKLKYITEKIGDGIHATPEYSDEGTIRFINGGSFGEDSIKMIGPMLSNEEYQKQNKSLLNEHTVMIALNGANFGNTSLYNNEAILLGKSAGYITLKSTVCREYVRYCLENSVTKEAFDLSLNGTTIPNLSLNTLRNTEICLPDYSVQKQLAKTIKKMIIKMDSLITEKESLINDLEAYKKSLIYEVVTGKRRVI